MLLQNASNVHWLPVCLSRHQSTLPAAMTGQELDQETFQLGMAKVWKDGREDAGPSPVRWRVFDGIHGDSRL